MADQVKKDDNVTIIIYVCTWVLAIVMFAFMGGQIYASNTRIAELEKMVASAETTVSIQATQIKTSAVAIKAIRDNDLSGTKLESAFFDLQAKDDTLISVMDPSFARREFETMLQMGKLNDDRSPAILEYAWALSAHRLFTEADASRMARVIYKGYAWQVKTIPVY